MVIPLAAIKVGRRIARREGSDPAVRRTATKITTIICRWTLEAVGLGWRGLAGVANRLRWMSERLDSMWIKCKVVEVRNLSMSVSVIIT
jgi:hypothetical protein